MVADVDGSNAASCYCLPNKMGRVFLLSLEDVIGRAALHFALSRARQRHLINNYPPANLDLGWHFEEMSTILGALDEIHGERAGRSIAVRAGRASFFRMQDDLGAVLGAALGPSVKLFRLPRHVSRLRAGLKAVAELYNKTGDQAVRLEETASQLLLKVDRCPICWGRSAETPICGIEVGLLREAMHWVSGGQHVAVEEVECIAAGSPSCCYAVEKHPLV